MVSLPWPSVAGVDNTMFGKALRSAVIVLVVRSALAMNCSIEPLYLDIQYQNVAGTSVKQWGSHVGMGSPPQNITLWPSLQQNETSVASLNFCTGSSLVNCTDSTGGAFDISSSSS